MNPPAEASQSIWGFPNIRDLFLGIPIIRTIVFGGLYWGSPILGNYHFYICCCLLIQGPEDQWGVCNENILGTRRHFWVRGAGFFFVQGIGTRLEATVLALVCRCRGHRELSLFACWAAVKELWLHISCCVSIP